MSRPGRLRAKATSSFTVRGGIHPEVLDAVASAERAGIEVILNTGRPAGYGATLLAYLPMVSAVIVENGGAWLDRHTPAPSLHTADGSRGSDHEHGLHFFRPLDSDLRMKLGDLQARVARRLGRTFCTTADNQYRVSDYTVVRDLPGGHEGAKMLAELVRTDRHNHRRVAGDSDLAEGIKIVARAHQNLIWERTRHTNRLRNSLREYYPAALATFDDLADRDTLAVLDRAPTPTEGRALTPGRVRTALRAGGRTRNIDVRAQAIVEGLRAESLEAPEVVAAAFAATTRSQVAIIRALNEQITALETELAAHFEQHPDADIYLSLPGLGVILSARVLAEFGDDPNRYANAKSRKNYAGTSPITRASGTRHVALARFVRPSRLADATDQWAFCSLRNSPGCRTYYDHRRANGNTHHQALRALGNRLVGILHGCLTHHSLYDETTAWAHRHDSLTDIAA